jgi:hypothetical protein
LNLIVKIFHYTCKPCEELIADQTLKLFFLMQKITKIREPFKKNGKRTYNKCKLFEGIHNAYMTQKLLEYYKK